MGLYSTFNTSQFYDEQPKQEVKQSTKLVTPRSNYEYSAQAIQSDKRRSLYEEAVTVASKKTEYGEVKFTDLYRVGQPVAVQNHKGEVRTKKGRIIEIVNDSLMYVSMEDSHKDVHDNWLVDFVTKDDKIFPL